MSLLVNKPFPILPVDLIGRLKEVNPSIITVLFKEMSDYPVMIEVCLTGLVRVGCLLWCSLGGFIVTSDDSSIDLRLPLPLLKPSV